MSDKEDALFTAATGVQPWSQLERVARDELSSGVSVADVVKGWQSLVEPLRLRAGWTDDADDAVLDTIDRLTGNCREQNRIQP